MTNFPTLKCNKPIITPTKELISDFRICLVTDFNVNGAMKDHCVVNMFKFAVHSEQ